MTEVEQQQVPDQVEDQPEVVEQLSIAELTGNEFESIEDLWKTTQEYRQTVASISEPEEDDEFLKGVRNYYKEHGDLKPYLEATSTNYDEMSDEGIMRASIRNQYPDASEKVIERMYNQQVIDKYSLSPETASEEDIEIGKEMLAMEARKVRESLKEKQKAFIQPEPKSKAEQAEIEAKIAEFHKQVDSNPFTKSLIESKSITVRDGDLEINYGIDDPESLVEMTKDNGKFWELFAGEDGQPNIQKFMEVAAFARDPQGFIAAVSKSAKATGAEDVISDIKNPSKPVGQTPTTSTMDHKDALLQAFVNAKS